jgi:hypothetical protein
MTSENEMKSAEAIVYPNLSTEDIEIPIQNLFDECLNFISVTDFDF